MDQALYALEMFCYHVAGFGQFEDGTVVVRFLRKDVPLDHGVYLLGHVAVPADVLVDLRPPAGSALVDVQDQGHHVLRIEGLYGS